MLTITNETPCMLCQNMISDGSMILMEHGFICENCCNEIASSELVNIEAGEDNIFEPL